MNWGDCLGQAKDAGGNVVGYVPQIKCLIPLFQNVINWALIFAGIVALIFVIWSGIKLITSKGDQKQVQGARSTLTWAIIGMILVFMSFFIVNFISVITGVKCINQFGFDNCDQWAPSSSIDIAPNGKVTTP